MLGRGATSDSNAPGRPFKYKHAKARPCPPECTPETWDRIYTAADARTYLSYDKDAAKSRADRENGTTWELARKMLNEKIAAGSLATTGSDAASPSPTTTANSNASATFADPSMDGINSILSIADKVKFGSRTARKTLSAATSDQGSPAPQSAASGSGVNAFAMNVPVSASNPMESSPAPASEPADAGKGEKRRRGKRAKKGTAQSIRKERAKGKVTRRDTVAESVSAGEDSSSETDDGQVYCICRKGDNHSLMIECEGGCDEWYHASCVNVDPEDAKNLLDKYVCSRCEIAGEKHTEWKIMCRLKDCRKPARLPASKYCSEQHRQQWGRNMVESMLRGAKSTPGGALTNQQLKAILKQVSSAKEFHALGKAPRLAQPPSTPGWEEILNPEEKDRLVEIQNSKDELERRREGFNYREKFVRILVQSAAAKMEELKAEGGGGGSSSKDSLCGYSSKLAMNEAELALWRTSAEGTATFADGVFAGDDVCARRGCARHKQWVKLSLQDVNFERSEIAKSLGLLQKERDGIYERAEIRAASARRC